MIDAGISLQLAIGVLSTGIGIVKNVSKFMSPVGTLNLTCAFCNGDHTATAVINHDVRLTIYRCTSLINEQERNKIVYINIQVYSQTMTEQNGVYIKPATHKPPRQRLVFQGL